MQYSDRNCSSSRTRGKWLEVTAAPAAMKAGTSEEAGTGEDAVGGGDARGAAVVEGGGEMGLVV